ncbi:MAG: PqqD family protein, partial [Planctomycetes bacterium]|nr:PqqD family protein [Planctomycetota bacterium]
MAATAFSEQSYRVNEPDVIHQLFDREVVVVDLRNGSYYSLSESGGAAWLAFGSGGALVGDVARLLTAVYTIPPDVAARDLQAFIAELTTCDLIVTCPPGTLSAATPTVATATAAYSPPELRSYNDLQELFLLDPVHAVDAEAGWPNAAVGEAAVPPLAAPAGAVATVGVDGAATGGELLTARLGGHTLLVNRDTGVYSTLDADRGITVHHDLETLMRPWIETDRPTRRAATAQGRQLLDRLEQSFVNDAASAGGPVQQWYRIGGHDVCVRTIPEQDARRLRPALGHLVFHEPPASAAGLIISAWNGATPSAAPVLADLLRRLRANWCAECGPRGEVLELHSVGISAIYNAGPNVLTVIDFERNRGWLLKLDDDAFPYWEVGSPFRFLLHEWFAARGLQYVHAAAVGTEKGGVLLVGKGGSG